MENLYAARLQEFGEAYEDFEASDIQDLIVQTGDRLAALCLNDEAVDEAMTRLHGSLGFSGFPIDHVGNRNWRDLWERTSLAEQLDLPLAQRLTSLNAYAYFGLSPMHDGQPCGLQDIKDMVDSVTAALRADLAQSANIERTLLAAQARLALDGGAGLSVEQLAALVRIGLKSMRNALAPSSGTGLETKDGLVTASSALNWLNARGDFKTSIWEAATRSIPANGIDAAEGEILWIPFASDNTEFHPVKCLRAGKYTVGPKGSEKALVDYREALDCLARMRPSAYWRRPNSAGNWGLVTAIGFHPRTVVSQFENNCP
jgi:hypothetical protein